MELTLFPTWLAAGLVWILLLTSSREVDPGYFRNCLLTVFGLLVLAVLASWTQATGWCRVLLITTTVSCYIGFVAWQIGLDRLGRGILLLLSALFMMLLWHQADEASFYSPFSMADAVSSSILLGASMAAMLLGHQYVFSPRMPIRSLNRLVVGVLFAAAVRSIIEVLQGTGPFVGSIGQMYLGLRWGVGIGGPIVLPLLALHLLEQNAIQPATGMLYVLVIFTFIGEAAGMVLGPTEAGPL